MDFEEPGERAARARADLLTAIVLVALGLVIFYLSWSMPRLEPRRIHPATIPGLVPMILGLTLAFCGALLGWRAGSIEAKGGWQALGRVLVSRPAVRILALLALALFYTLVLVGWLPFWAASMLFIFTFILLFELSMTDQPADPLRSGIWALAIAVTAGWGIFFVFERIFLVRLP
ncbi:tripartite tricarboxylate transporter TctB family protein [Chelativorans sp.]|uniref:tripartite tricarboxylate transporter TctB family protein n=1 Tax=Chelativorans sp. TaxID=2203393 RepID=UPI00281144F0|nr:tripartite tricarboxylate transporter TctB family protein [Chelativorans sp.]